MQPEPDSRMSFAKLDAPAPSGRFACRHLGCEKCFQRKGDLERHVTGTHLKSKPHVCPAVGCFKKQQPNTFARKDKLADHLTAMHDHRMLCICPSDDCDKTPRRADEVYAHLQLAHRGYKGYAALERLCDPSRRLIPCPILSCKSNLHFNKLPDHVLEHDHRDISNAANSLQVNNFIAVREGCPHSRWIGEQVSCLCPFTAVRLRCPVCSLTTECQGFEQHMEDAHYVHPDEVEHFKIWQAYCKSLGFTTAGKFSRWTMCNPLRRKASCPVCSWQSDSFKLDHHCDMRGDLSSLRAHRMEIFRFYEDILSGAAWKSIWEDLAQPFGPPVSDAADPSTTQQADQFSSSG